MQQTLKKILKRVPLISQVANISREALLPHPLPTSTKSPIKGPLVVAGMFNTASGLGETARQAIRVLTKQGHTPIAVDLSEPFGQIDFNSAIDLTNMPRTDTGTLLLYVNPPETRAALQFLGLRRWHNWHIIGSWAWELNVAPPGWVDVARHLSEVWTCSAFASSAFDDQVPHRVKTVPISVSPPSDLDVSAIAKGPHPLDDTTMRVLVMADGKSSFHRKNIFTAVNMFNQAFGDTSKAQLTLKLRNAHEFPQIIDELSSLISDRKNITLIDASISSAQRWQMIMDHDVILSAHRAEGFGLHLAEAMSLGKVVIATGWSGNMTFMNTQNAILLPYTLQPVSDPYGIYQPPEGAMWAEVNQQAGEKALKRIADNREAARQIGARASASIVQSLSGRELLEALNLATPSQAER